MIRIISGFLFLALLISCSDSDGGIIIRGSNTAPAGSSYDLLIDDSFSYAALTADQKTWYDRMWAHINLSDTSKLPERMMGDDTFDDLTGSGNDADYGYAVSNDVYNYGRQINLQLTALLHAFRVTGEKALLDYIDVVMQKMRAQLEDWSITSYQGSVYEADGYQNWRYWYDAGYEGTDVHEMDEIMAHSFVAAATYAYYINRSYNATYLERYNFWIDYLQNEFEAKWRDRKSIPTAFPFLTKKLFHPYLQWIRYHYYMGIMTGESDYTTEAAAMADIIELEIWTETASCGDALQWNHGVSSLGETCCESVQNFGYASYSVQTFVELAMEGFDVFPSLLPDVACMVEANIHNSTAPSDFAGFIDGTGTREPATEYGYRSYGQIGHYNTSVRSDAITVHNSIESNDDVPQRLHLPAAIFLSYFPEE